MINENLNPHQAAVSDYHRKRQEGDIDLIKKVRDELVAAGLSQKLPDAYDNNRFIKDAVDKPSNVQCYFLNRYWSLQLMTSSKPSSEERFCLVSDGSMEDWLRLFKAKILPFVIENNLPTVM